MRWTVEAGRDLWEDLAAGPAKSAVLESLTAFGFYCFLLVSTGCVQHHVGGLLLRWPWNIHGQVRVAGALLPLSCTGVWMTTGSRVGHRRF